MVLWSCCPSAVKSEGTPDSVCLLKMFDWIQYLWPVSRQKCVTCGRALRYEESQDISSASRDVLPVCVARNIGSTPATGSGLLPG